MTGVLLTPWVAVPAAILLVCGGLLTLVGSLGLLRLETFYARMHAPTLGMTLGAGCVLVASMVVSSALSERLVIHEVLIAGLLTMTAPVTAILLMRAARSRSSNPVWRVKPVSLPQAMKNPNVAFASPEALEASTEFTAIEKRAILVQWKDQLEKLLIADEEGMLIADEKPGANADCLRRITSILTRLPR